MKPCNNVLWVLVGFFVCFKASFGSEGSDTCTLLTGVEFKLLCLPMAMFA